MKVVQVYNQQRSIGGGEENVVLQTTAWLRENGIQTDLLLRSSRGIENSFIKKMKVAATGVYNPEAYRYLRRYLAKHRPSVVHAHNIYPQWSPAVFLACRDAGVPILFTTHCQILTCPTWYHFYKGKVCEKCLESGEHWCILQNCRKNFAESIVYALRSYVVRKYGWFHKAVTRIITPSEFVRQRLISAGFQAGQIQTIWNAVQIPKQKANPQNGQYVAFAGRLSQEKGVELLLKVARSLPDVLFRVAGTGPMENKWSMRAPSNVRFEGFLRGDELSSFYQNARLLVVPSISFETFAITAAEGMAHGLPVVASRIGGMPELVGDNINGFLVEPGNIAAWLAAIGQLWSNPMRCQEIGLTAREWARSYLSKELYISRLIATYRDAQVIVSGRNSSRDDHE